MYFEIQVSNPMIKQHVEGKVSDLAEAIETIFPLDTEDAFLLWNWIPVRISYKYDLSVLIEDLILLLDNLLDFDSGSNEVHWGSNTFMSDWVLNWSANKLTISSKWGGVSGNYEALLNSRSELEVDKDLFLSEWKELLRKIIEVVDKTDVTIVDSDAMDSVRRIEAAIPRSGHRYSI